MLNMTGPVKTNTAYAPQASYAPQVASAPVANASAAPTSLADNNLNAFGKTDATYNLINAFREFLKAFMAKTMPLSYEKFWGKDPNRGPVAGFDPPAAGYPATPGSAVPSTPYTPPPVPSTPPAPPAAPAPPAPPKTEVPKGDGMQHPTKPNAPKAPHTPSKPHGEVPKAPGNPGTPAPKPGGEVPKAPGNPTTPTPAPGTPAPPPTPAPGTGTGVAVPPNTRDINKNYRSLTTDERVKATNLTPTELGLLHAGGRGLSFTGSREGIYQSYWTLLEKLDKGEKVSERDRAAILEAKAMDEKEGLPSGASFEKNYLATLDKLTGSNHFSQMTQGLPPVKDDGRRLQTPDNLNPGTQQFIDFQKSIGNTNANYGNMMVITQWNHDLLDDGKINGSMSAHELASQQKGTSLVEGGDSQKFLQGLLEHEMVDGQFNNSNAEFFIQAFDSAYNKNIKPVELADIEAATKTNAAASGVTLEKVKQLATSTVQNFLQGGMEGFSAGIKDHAKSMAEKPGTVAANAGSMALTAVCPYVGSLGLTVGNTNKKV
jgi:hypothetical protein